MCHKSSTSDLLYMCATIPDASWVDTSNSCPSAPSPIAFGPSISAVTDRSQQAARVDLISQSCPQHARAAACNGIWPPESAGRAGSGSARPLKSSVRAGPAGAAGRRGHRRPAWSDSDWPRPRPRRLHAAAGRNQGRNTARATTH